MPPAEPVADARLHVVTGKGGTGKTSVAAALATAFAARGERVLLTEVEGRQGLAQVFDVAPLGEDERTLLTDPSGGEVVGLSVDARAALLEYLHRFYRLGPAGAVLQRVGAVDFATTIAPGVRDVLLIGKVYEAVGRTTRRDGPVFDRVVLDAPPTGRIGRFLAVNSEVSQVARVGPIRSQADSITRMLSGPETVVHLVTLLEEMPVQETRDAVAELTDLSLRVGWVVANLVDEPLLLPEDLPTASDGVDDVLDDLVTEGLAAAEVSTLPAMVTGLVREARDHLARAALQARLGEELAGLGRPVATLPGLPDGLEGGGLGVLADALDEQGVTG
ncbi:ArsA-related P-loop ATPase [Janibacter alkaliphilus]|uniref:Anion-transporting ArsA/GET3 family ATPase n=1 Tax=Janibacter alkaliphilus TaxID=1069963 RepID=A0A852XBZ4_9MICO|nr:anion-transporting ArsA/GET3 family ATPase [Janibacter alkaliphilus]